MTKQTKSSSIFWIFAILILWWIIVIWISWNSTAWYTSSSPEVISKLNTLKNGIKKTEWEILNKETWSWVVDLALLIAKNAQAKEQLVSNELPIWTVMAFTNNCPSGGRRIYEPAIWRFILGWNSNIWTTTWNASNWEWNVALTVKNLPSHKHAIKLNKASIWWVINWTNYSNDWRELVSSLWWALIWWAKNSPDTSTNTENVWGWNNINILNPYITLVYCEKYK